jgi:hypothetical protein
MDGAALRIIPHSDLQAMSPTAQARENEEYDELDDLPRRQTGDLR